VDKGHGRLEIRRLWASAELVSPTVMRAGDWPGWRGTTGCGTTDEKDLVLKWDGKSGEGVAWKTPLGNVSIVEDFCAQLMKQSPRFKDMPEAHSQEHSIEVQLPFLQFLYGDAFKIVPICFLMQDYDSAVEVGRALEEALNAVNAVVIASSDMTHYEPAKRAAEKDQAALKAVSERKYEPTILDGEPTPVDLRVEVNFQM
jgi:hypothetical protein